MQRNSAATVVILSVALLSAHCAAAHRHVTAHHAKTVRTSSGPAPHLATVSADISGHVFHMPRRIHRAHLRAARLHSLHHPSIRFRSPYEGTTGTGASFAIENWSAPYFVAYPAALAGSKPELPSPTRIVTAPRPTADGITSMPPAESSSRTASAFESAPASDPTNPPAPADAPGVDAVIIVFKDGRPSQQVRNYILTRKTLFIGDDDQPAIPVEQLDLTATIKANEEAGVVFQVPPTIQ